MIIKSKHLSYSILLVISLQLTACMTTPTIAENQRPQQWGKLVNKQHNFYQISQTVYRSEQPSSEAISELQKNHIDIVVNLRNRDKDKLVLANQPFKLVHIPINTWAIDRDDLLKVMQTIQTAQQQNQKVLIHCYHGSDRTGASIAMYRIIFENWSIDDALNEMKHGGYGFHPIWVNIEKLFTPENVKWIREQLANPS